MIAMTNNEYLKDFVPYPLALRLKELGFDEPCFGWFTDSQHLYIDKIINGKMFNSNNGCLAPTFSQSFRFFRDNYDLLGIPTYSKYTIMSNKWVGQPLYGNYNSYEEAELACLEKLLEIVESKK